ncbi:NhaP-type Na+/H+ or K+/H+ antiporter, partial [Phyllobacterium trifolii]|nr:NhaP-type Na+/H+ or K+/H+ antiporter [Phyllobacterium trifolii]
GLGSFYYMAYATGHAAFDKPDILWVTVSLVVLVSIILHGIVMTPVMRRRDRRQKSVANAL